MKQESPTLRLVHFDIPAVGGALKDPSLRLAHQPGSQCDNGIKEGGWKNNNAQLCDIPPALLVSYFYIEPFLKNKQAYRYRDWVMDSGAFSAHNSGKKIDLQKYTDLCLQLLAEDQTLTEVYALDVIGDPDASLKNTEEMWRQGVPAIPCYHRGEPEEHLFHMAKHYPKIALGGVAMLRGDQKLQWLTQCFARVWPKRIHGFGMAGEEIVYALPFHSVDATNWELAPCAFGSWQKFGQMSVRGSNQDLRSQVKHYLALEAKARVRWEKEMAILAALPDQWPPARPTPRVPTVRLAVEPHSGRAENNFTGVKDPKTPAVRLAVADPAKDRDPSSPRGKRTTKATGAKATNPPVPEVSKPPGEMDNQWVDYWKKRL